MTTWYVYVDASTGAGNKSMASYCRVIATPQGEVVSVHCRHRYVHMESFDAEMWAAVDTLRWISDQRRSDKYRVFSDANTVVRTLTNMIHKVSNATTQVHNPSVLPNVRDLTRWNTRMYNNTLFLTHMRREAKILRLADRCARWSYAGPASLRNDRVWERQFTNMCDDNNIKWTSPVVLARAADHVSALRIESETIKQRALSRQLDRQEEVITFDALVNQIVERNITVAFSSHLG